MNPDLLEYRCDRRDISCRERSSLSSGRRYPIRDGVPRFESNREHQDAIQSFGDEWNRFKFSDFHLNWLNHNGQEPFSKERDRTRTIPCRRRHYKREFARPRRGGRSAMCD
jgi:hypothetical protein